MDGTGNRLKHFASILGELLSAGLGVQGTLWATSPACTELETHVLDWFVDLLSLPTAFKSTSTGGGVIQDSASSATLCASLAARERATEGRSNLTGADGSLVAYSSTQAHSSVEKGVQIAGLGSDNLRLIEVDENYAMRTDRLAEAIAKDLADGQRPCFVGASIGTTSATAIDPIAAIGQVCREHRLSLHVDAGTAALCLELQFLHDGLESADSYCFNSHKWMFTNGASRIGGKS
jgi:aromatic-L-amino-acid/L-tryptophan decarboxylase